MHCPRPVVLAHAFGLSYSMRLEERWRHMVQVGSGGKWGQRRRNDGRASVAAALPSAVWPPCPFSACEVQCGGAVWILKASLHCYECCVRFLAEELITKGLLGKDM